MSHSLARTHTHTVSVRTGDWRTCVWVSMGQCSTKCNWSASTFFLLLRTVQYILKLFKFPFHPQKFAFIRSERMNVIIKVREEKKTHEKENHRLRRRRHIIFRSTVHLSDPHLLYGPKCASECKWERFARKIMSAFMQTHIFLSACKKYWFLYHVNSWYFKIIFLCGQRVKFIFSL